MKNTAFDDIKKSDNINEMAALISNITWGCGDCSPDSKEQCKECLITLLNQTMEDIING